MTCNRASRSEGKTVIIRLKVLRTSVAGAIVFLLIVCLKYQIQGQAHGRSLLTLSGLQRVETVPAGLARGQILDRYGVPLTGPVWQANCVVFPQLVRDEPMVAEALEQIFGKPVVSAGDPRWSGGRPVKVASGLDGETARKVAALAWAGLEGVYVVPEERRYGPESLACHVVGYVPPSGYSSEADNAGQMGLEKYFDGWLKGSGTSWVGLLVAGDRSAFPGSSVRIGAVPAEPRHLFTTIDARIQRIVERTMDSNGISRGAVVVLDVDTCEVLAMASRPAFRQDVPGASIGLENAPFVNRAVSPFMPGSVFKAVVAAAALESGVIGPEERFECRGVIEVGGREVRCPKAHGELTVKEAIAHSCNSVLIQIAQKTGAPLLVEFAGRAGFSRLTGIELPEDHPGYLPEPWKMLPGDVANLAIGQGYLGVSPLQVATFFRALVTGSTGTPTLVLSPAQDFAEGNDAGAEKTGGVRAGDGTTRLLSESTCRVLRESLVLGTTEGTGRLAWVPGFGSAGKTGTAEVEGRPPHAWFAGFCPVIAPRYAIVVFVENGGEGPAVAAPLFRQIASAILER